MARKHNTKHDRSPSKYKKRLQERGLGKTPRMTFTGLTTAQIQEKFNELPHYRWLTETYEDDYGRKHTRTYRQMVDA